MKLCMALALATMMTTTACEDEESELAIIHANSAYLTNNPWPRCCDELPDLHCDAVELHESLSGNDWPCPCVGPALIKVDQEPPTSPVLLQVIPVEEN